MTDILDRIRQDLIDSDLTPNDLRTALEIIDQYREEEHHDEG